MLSSVNRSKLPELESVHLQVQEKKHMYTTLPMPAMDTLLVTWGRVVETCKEQHIRDNSILWALLIFLPSIMVPKSKQ